MAELPHQPGETSFTLRRAAEIAARRTVISSGSSTLDSILDGGFKTGEMVEVFGGRDTGKTQLAMQTAIEAAARGFFSVFVDTEGQFRPERLSSISSSRGVEPGPVLQSVYSIRAESTERQLDAIVNLRKEEALTNCRLVVIDTLSKNFTLEYGGSKSTGRRQTALGAYLNTISRDAFQHDRAVILLNRVASVSSDGNEREVDIGGETVRHFVQKVVYLRRSGDFVMASRPDILGGEVRLRIAGKGLV